MKAIRVHQTGGPDVLALEDLPDPVPASRPGARADSRGRRESGRHLHPVGAPGPASRPCPTRRARMARAWSRPSAPASRAVAVGDRVYLSGTAAGALTPAPTPNRRVCAADHVHPLAADAVVRAGRRRQRAVRHGVPGRCSTAPSARPGETVLVHGGSGGVGIAAIQIARAHGHDGLRHGRHGPRPRARRRAGRAPRVRPHAARLPRRDPGRHGRTRRRRHHRDARQRQSRQGPRPARRSRPRRRRRQPRPRRDRCAPDDGAGCGDPGHDADERLDPRTACASTPRSSRDSPTARCGPSSAASSRSPRPLLPTSR